MNSTVDFVNELMLKCNFIGCPARREGSLTKASEELYLSQPALSHQMKELEHELGVRIFKRTNNRMVLTEIGEIIRSHSQDSLEIIASLYDNLSGAKEEIVSNIRLCIQNYSSYHWIGPIIEQFHTRYPNVEIEIITESTRKPLELMRNDQLDMAIMHTCPIDKEFRIERIFKNEIVLVVHKNHRLADAKYIELDDLADQTLILNTTKDEIESLINSVINLHSLQFQKIMHVNLTDSIIHMVNAGIGVSLLPSWLVSTAAHPDLRCIQITHRPIETEWYCASNDQVQHESMNNFQSLIEKQLKPFDKRKEMYVA